MNTVIYADILFVINMMVNYLLLRVSAAVTSDGFKVYRLLLSSGAGGLFAMIILIDGIPQIIHTLLRILFPPIMTATAFGVKNVRAFLKNTAAFYLANFVFAGIMLGICTAVKSNFVLYRNGVVYFDVDILTLTVVSLVCYGILTLFSRLVKLRNPRETLCEIAVTDNGKTVTGTAFYDTGNSLCDSFSGRPVIIAEKGFLEELYGKDFDCTELKNFRLVPYTTIRNGGALPAFSVEKVAIKCFGNFIEADKIFVAVTERKINTAGQCALVGPNVFDAVENKIKLPKNFAGGKKNEAVR